MQMPWQNCENTTTQKVLVYFLIDNARRRKVVPSKTKSIHKLCVVTSSKNLLLDTELCASKS